MEKKIVLCADSTCDLSPELKERYHVHCFPFHVILEDKTYGDGYDLMPDQIYEVYRARKVLPKTAAINMAEYAEFCQQWLSEDCDVIYITIGSGLSAAFNNCRMAAEGLPAPPVGIGHDDAADEYQRQQEEGEKVDERLSESTAHARNYTKKRGRLLSSRHCVSGRTSLPSSLPR